MVAAGLPGSSGSPDSAGSGVVLRRAENRFATRLDWLDSRHSFSFGAHYDPDDVGFGLLVVHNDDLLTPGAGFDTHPHRDMEIVTWVLDGSLVHEDSTGHSGVLEPGLVQRMTAGRGILHSERNAAGGGGGAAGGGESASEVHYVQMWVVPDEPGLEPGYAQRQVAAELGAGGLFPVVSGLRRHRDATIGLANRDAALHAARLEVGAGSVLPSAPFVHLFVARGSIDLEGVGVLVAGDAARLTGSDGRRVVAREPAEILVWEMHRSLR